MRRGVWIVLLLVLIAAGVAALIYGYIRPPRREAGQGSRRESRSIESRLIAVAPPTVRTFVVRVPWVGVIQSTSTVELIALVAGRVQSLAATDEMPIQAGASVMVLGGPLIVAQQAKIEANLESLQSQLGLAHQNVQRLEQNIKEQLSTRNDLATAQEAQLKLQAQVRDAQMALQALQEQTHVVAPIAGVFTNRRVNIGQTVKADDVLGAIVDPNHLRVVASLFPPAQTPLTGKEATVRITTNRTVPGIVRRIVPQADSLGATTVWIEGPQIDQQLRPGQTVAGEVIMEVRPSSWAVPESAVLYHERDQPYVLVEVQGRYERRNVRLGLTQEGWVEILSGLQPGESVVTQGAYEIAGREFSSQYRVED
ncbi:MAG: efflux RND transporter periplasmic adaptor subunit [Planctomycetes bacterium]|nr:efflux RND transporter periplasmic adaptor subunit [Planctomycetota bacterium]